MPPANKRMKLAKPGFQSSADPRPGALPGFAAYAQVVSVQNSPPLEWGIRPKAGRAVFEVWGTADSFGVRLFVCPGRVGGIRCGRRAELVVAVSGQDRPQGAGRGARSRRTRYRVARLK